MSTASRAAAIWSGSAASVATTSTWSYHGRPTQPGRVPGDRPHPVSGIEQLGDQTTADVSGHAGDRDERSHRPSVGCARTSGPTGSAEQLGHRPLGGGSGAPTPDRPAALPQIDQPGVDVGRPAHRRGVPERLSHLADHLRDHPASAPLGGRWLDRGEGGGGQDRRVPGPEVLRPGLGAEARPKDFRTWPATVLAAAALAAVEPPASERGRRRVVTQVVREVAEALGNTPAVCRASYIDPRLIDLWERGRTIGRRRTRAAAERAVAELLG